ncbi:MAG: DUF2397 family protein, partial [Actinomycetota bacterium]|nr:DUF2397 family protein [Actinomycetota bacterium]
LGTSGSVPLSSFGGLDHALFERLLELLGQALAAVPDRSGARRGSTADGRIEIILTPPADASVAELKTPRGVFRGPDYSVEIRAHGARRVRRASEAG